MSLFLTAVVSQCLSTMHELLGFSLSHFYTMYLSIIVMPVQPRGMKLILALKWFFKNKWAREVGEGDEYDQNTSYKILKD